MKNIKILVATHKKYDMPASEMYLPLHVGYEVGKENLGYARDNEGENISIKNPYFCELTGLYWAWKNLEAEYIGLVHYRRHFKGKEKFLCNGKTKKILSYDEAQKLLDKTDVILPSKRNYYIETIYSHYVHTMYPEPLEKTEEIIKSKFPEYLAEFENLKKRKTAHMFNMFVMKKDVFDRYCSWLFEILFELEKQVDANSYDSFHARFFGRISEILLDVWLRTNNINYSEVKFFGTEKTNWFKKGFSFLKAKFGKKKYEKSF